MSFDLSEVFLFLETSQPEPELKQARLGNALALLKSALGEKSWVGLYMATPTRLLLGSFQGTHACEIIAFGKGVVGACYERDETVAVADVTAFPGYICCDESAKSEICVPIRKGNEVVAILDIDLSELHKFSEKEMEDFEKVAAKLALFI